MAKKTHEETSAYIASLVARARTAQAILNDYTQEQVDKLVAMIAYEMTRLPVRQALSDLALEETELGDIPSKLAKIETKVKGVYNDIKHEKTVGIVERDEAKGLVRIKKPAGVIGALIPSTQPEMIPITATEMGIKTRNATIFAPHPRGKKTTWTAVDMMRKLLKEHGCPEDAIICIDPEALSVEATQELMVQADLVMATGGAGMVKAAYSSGTPAYGVGAGNAVMVIDDTADIKDAAHKIMLSKTGDLAAGCSCDNALVIFDNIYDEMIAALKAEGAYLCQGKEEHDKIQKAIFPTWPADHNLNRNTCAKPAKVIAGIAGIEIPDDTKFIMVEETGTGFEYPLSGEKLCIVLTVYKVYNLEEAIDKVNAIQAYSGAGHSCGIYSNNQANIEKYALQTHTVRVNNNLPNSIVNTGSWLAGYPFSPSVGCGTWGGNICSKNVTLEFYMNDTWLATGIERKIPTDEDLFGDMGVIHD